MMDSVSFFNGTYSVSMDAKGRISLPAVWRNTLLQECDNQNGDCTLYVFEDLQYPSLRFFPWAKWREMHEKVAEIRDPRWERSLHMTVFGSAKTVSFNKEGRLLVLIDKATRERTDWSGNNELDLIGEGRSFSLWRKDALQDKQANREVAGTRKQPEIPKEILYELHLWENLDRDPNKPWTPPSATSQ